MGLDTVELILFAEKEFAIALPDSRLAEIRTVGEFAALVKEQCGLTGQEVDHATVLDWVKRTLVSRFRVPESKITSSAEFVRDLGLDQ